MENLIKENNMASKIVKSQFKKALQLIKEGWPHVDAIEVTYTSLTDELSFEEYEEIIERELDIINGEQNVA
jgi:hypothetical protein